MSRLGNWLETPGSTIDCEDDLEAVQSLFLARGWSDGLPVIPPTPERVEAMLAYCDRPWDEPFMTVPPRYAPATPARIATNAVMAGLRPVHFPLVLAAFDALNEPEFNLYGIQATTHPCTPLLLFGGPLAVEAGIHGGNNAFGQGYPANATIGRAVRLALVNIGGAFPGIGDMATQGTPAKFAYCCSENEAESPWEPLRVELGLPAEATTVTVIAAEGPHNINDHESTTAIGVLKSIAGTVAITGANNAYHPTVPAVAISPEHARTIADGGYTKQAVKEYLYEHARLPLGRFSDENIERRLRTRFPERFANAGLDAGVPMAQSPEEFMVFVAGGAGKHSAYIPTFGSTRPVTRVVATADGVPARRLDDFRR
jgi:hypothetical protein